MNEVGADVRDQDFLQCVKRLVVGRGLEVEAIAGPYCKGAERCSP